ncbi:MAG TPA: hypothetical protein DCQ32_01975 [Cyanobacteria bacterium UBA8156]|nr:hypothetical protein [Cyanobacteria bacterium UBA8156]
MSDPYGQWQAVQSWVRQGEWATLQEQWQGQNPEMRQAILSALGESSHPQAIALLTEGLQDDDPEIQDLAGKALGRMGETAVPILSQAIATLGERAALALTRIHHPTIVPPLLAVWSHLSDRGRAQVLAALHPWRDAAVLAQLQAALDDPAPIVQREAVIGLGLAAQQGESTDLSRLVPFLAHPDLAPAAVEALGRAKAVERLRRSLPAAPAAVIPAIAVALAGIGTEEALVLLASLLDTAVNPIPIVVGLARHGGAAHLVKLWHQQHPCFGQPAVRRELAIVAQDPELLTTLTSDEDALVALYARHRLTTPLGERGRA